MFNKGDKVKINFNKLKAVGKYYDEIVKFDEEREGNHIITNIYYKSKYFPTEHVRIELDEAFVFYEEELIKEG
jgi:hypothetical protein